MSSVPLTWVRDAYGGFHYATCECGWLGRLRRKLAYADRDAAEHNAKHLRELADEERARV